VKAIEIKNLSYQYPDGTQALSKINLSISPGERVAILGPNGAGKSTLLLHLNGTLQGKGEIEVFSLPVNKQNLNKIRSLVGMVFQDPDDQLFLTTVYDDVAFGPLNQSLPPEEIDQRVLQALGIVGMSWAVSKSAHHLSFGEKKRVAIATVLAMNPEILVLDEPTSNLDPRNRKNLLNLLTSFSHTLIVATHDMDFAWHTCHRVILLSNGRIIADGVVQEILRNQKLLASEGLEVPACVLLESVKQ
jgi:cobalt/nickel transport system ATP-binding protein